LTRTEVVAVVSLAVSLAATPAAAAAAMRLGVVDRPGLLKLQSTPVPYLGGIGVLAGLLVGAAVSRPLLVVPLVAATALGTADDVADLKPWIRLAGQIVIGIVVAAVIPTRLDRPLGFVLVTVVTVLLINGTNLIDGLDALASGVAAAAGGALALVLHGDPRMFACCLAVSALGFLFYNRPPARVYLGDGGAYLIGTAFAVLLAWGVGQRSPPRGGSLQPVDRRRAGRRGRARDRSPGTIAQPHGRRRP
jgi:UDP-GlcNAc:undecaprenyl-phosphate GlcNAc-1-phosphate transferase